MTPTEKHDSAVVEITPKATSLDSVPGLHEAPQSRGRKFLKAAGCVLLLTGGLIIVGNLVTGKRPLMSVTSFLVLGGCLLFLGTRKQYVPTNPNDILIRGVTLMDGSHYGSLFLTSQGVLFQPRGTDLSKAPYGIANGFLCFPRTAITGWAEQNSLKALGKVVEIAMAEGKHRYHFKMSAAQRRQLLTYLGK